MRYMEFKFVLMQMEREYVTRYLPDTAVKLLIRNAIKKDHTTVFLGVTITILMINKITEVL